ncbi:hypothetical protein Tco_0543775 [Tanacetum coccineum]
MEDEFYHLTVKGNDLNTYVRRIQELATLCPTMVPDSEKMMEVFIGGLPRSIEGNVTASKPQTLEEAINIAQRRIDQWYEGLKDGDLKDEALKEKSILEGSWGHENRKENNFCSWLKESFGINNGNDAIQANQEWFDDHELMKDDDDDIRDLDNNLISKGFKERKSKLIGIPYEKPPTFKSENFEVIKYSFGPVEEYVTIKEYEYDIWVRTKENMSHVYQESFCKKDEGWSLKRTK